MVGDIKPSKGNPQGTMEFSHETIGVWQKISSKPIHWCGGYPDLPGNPWGPGAPQEEPPPAIASAVSPSPPSTTCHDEAVEDGFGGLATIGWTFHDYIELNLYINYIISFKFPILVGYSDSVYIALYLIYFDLDHHFSWFPPCSCWLNFHF